MNRKRIARNLKFLRKKYNLSQEELAQKVRIGKSTISEYENCKREPQIRILHAISKYFNIDFEKFVFENIEEFITDVNINAKEMKELFIYSLPFLNVKNKEPDIHFKNAYKNNEIVYSKNIDGKVDLGLLGIIKKNYVKSWEENKCIEALVNLISIIIYEHQIILPYESDLDKKLLKIIKENGYYTNLSNEQFDELSEAYLSGLKSDKVKKIKTQYFESERNRVNQCIKILRQHYQNEVCDYFLGLKLYYGFTDLGYDDPKEIQQSAIIYLASLAIDFDNCYAKKFFKYMEKFFD